MSQVTAEILRLAADRDLIRLSGKARSQFDLYGYTQADVLAVLGTGDLYKINKDEVGHSSGVFCIRGRSTAGHETYLQAKLVNVPQEPRFLFLISMHPPPQKGRKKS